MRRESAFESHPFLAPSKRNCGMYAWRSQCELVYVWCSLTAVNVLSLRITVLTCVSSRPDRDSATHIGLPSALALVKKLRPARTLLVGMAHTFGDHDTVNEVLKKSTVVIRNLKNHVGSVA